MNRAELAESLERQGIELVLADGLDDAYMGWTMVGAVPVAVYSVQRILKMLQDNGMEADEALEYYEYNIAGSHVGLQTPLYIEESNA